LMAREIIWTIIQWAPFFKEECKPRKKTDIMKLSIDEQIVKKEKEKIPKVTEKDLKIFEKLRDGMVK